MSHPSRTLEILKSLVSFNTVSDRSNLPCIDWIEDYLAGFGLKGERFYDETGQKASLWVTIGDASQAGYILSAHTDVVPVDGQHWDTDPFTLVDGGDRVFGRGTTDMKGYLAATLNAVPMFLAAKRKTPIHLAFSYDEEIGCLGVRPMLAELAKRGAAPLGCFVGEPSNMEVIIGHKGKINLTVTVRGKGGHSSLAPLGVNAIEYAARLIAFIRELGADLRHNGARDALYDVPHTTAHVGTIRGGQALNIIPEHCVFEYEFRTIAADDAEALHARVVDYARTVLEPEMKAIAPETGFEFVIENYSPDLDMQDDAPVVTLAKALSQRNGHSKVAYNTEAGLFQKMLGTPTIIAGPGDIRQAHQPNEYILKSELTAAEQWLERLCAQLV